MNKKSFFLGALTGVVLTIAVIVIIALVKQNVATFDPIQYLEQPVSYENKTQTSFKVLQVLSANAALATESSNGSLNWFDGNTVLIIGTDYYTDQIVTFNNPQWIGTYSYTSQKGMPLTVPVIMGE